MGLWDIITGQFVDVIEWSGDSHDVMVKRFDREDNEIKYGAMLTVRESQTAVFVNEGTIADTFAPGLYQLETANLPVLTTLQSWQHGFNSPFKAEVYFVSSKQFVDLKWGTRKPIMTRDPEFGPVRFRGFGTYSIRISDPTVFLQQVAGTDHYFTTGEITDQLRNIIVSRFAEIVADANIPMLDLAGNYSQLGQFLQDHIAPQFKEFGLELTSLLVENISMPDEVEAALDKRTAMGVVGDLSKYTTFQAAEAVTKAAENAGGSDAISMGVGFAMANKLGATLGNDAQAAASATTPPPLPNQQSYYIVVNGKRSGPFDLQEMQEQASNGTLHHESLVWHSGLSDWQVASAIDEVAKLLNDLPPPLPS